MESVKKLNLGCGTDIKSGWVNLDSSTLPGVDIVHDIAVLPLPFPDGQFDEILCRDILEHLDYVAVLRDIHRTMSPGALLHIRVPHFTSKHNFIDPTHKKLFSINTFDFFVKNSALKKERAYYFDFTFERIASRRITFERSSRIYAYNRIAEWLVNRSPRSQEIYESTAFSRLCPAYNIEITLVK